MQYTDDLQTMRGAVQRARYSGQGTGIDPTLIDTFLNYRMRQVLDARPYWSGLIARGVLTVPQQYSTGTVSVTQFSNVVTGVGTSWPVSDLVNTTLSASITNPGYQGATPAAMTNITTDTLLLIDNGLSTQEVVPVNEVYPTSFKANFQYTHSSGATITCASIVYQQFVLGFQFPIYTITGVQASTSLLLDQPWAAPSITATSYNIRKQYYTFGNGNLKDLLSVVDPQNSYALQLHYPRVNLDAEDPQRSAVDWPLYVVDYSPNLNGNFQHEIYPPPTSARSLYWLGVNQWPDMKARTDKPPSFIDPSILVMGALADAYRVRLPGENPNGNMQISQMWEMRFREALTNAMSSDNGKRMAAYEWPTQGYPFGSTWNVNHDIDVWSGNY